MADYVPRGDGLFDEWLVAFTRFAESHGVALGISPAQLADLVGATGAWQVAYQGHHRAQFAARSAKAGKDGRRGDVESLVRQFTRVMQANKNITDALRADAGITIPDRTLTPLSASLVEETKAPLLLLDWSQRERVMVHFGHNPSNEHRNALPEGMLLVKLWCAMGGIPNAEEDWRFLDDCARSPYVHVLANSEPVTVAYRAQYVDRRLRRGPFSNPVVVTVTP